MVHAITASTFKNVCAACINVPIPYFGWLSTSPVIMARHPIPIALDAPLIMNGNMAGIYSSLITLSLPIL